MKRILNLSWAEIAEICGFSSSSSARNSYHNRSKIFKFGKVVVLHYNNQILELYKSLKKTGNIETISLLITKFKIMKCLNCGTEITGEQLELNDDCCPKCGYEHDPQTTIDDEDSNVDNLDS